MFIAGAAAFLVVNQGDANALFTINNLAHARLSNYDLAVIPLFMLMGQFATHGGLSKALFRCAAAFVGHLRGGLAMAAAVACAGFGAICGSSLATAATMRTDCGAAGISSHLPGLGACGVNVIHHLRIAQWRSPRNAGPAGRQARRERAAVSAL